MLLLTAFFALIRKGTASVSLIRKGTIYKKYIGLEVKRGTCPFHFGTYDYICDPSPFTVPYLCSKVAD